MKNSLITKKKKESRTSNMGHNIRFISLVLGLLFVLNALKDYSCAHAHLEDWDMDKDKLVAFSKKELVDHDFTATRKIGLGGRKMVVHHEEVMRRKESDDEKELDFHGKYSSKDISGEQNNALVKSLQISQDQYLNQQKNMNKLKRKKQKSAGSLGTPRSSKAEAEAVNLPTTNPTTKHSNQESKKFKSKTNFEMERSTVSSSRSENQETGLIPEVETQRLLEATKEIVNLMNKDYKGMDRPRRKPPINNHVPIH